MSGWAKTVTVFLIAGALAILVFQLAWNALTVLAPYIVIVLVTAFLGILVSRSVGRLRIASNILLALGVAANIAAISFNYTEHMTSAVLFWTSIPFYIATAVTAVIGTTRDFGGEEL